MNRLLIEGENIILMIARKLTIKFNKYRSYFPPIYFFPIVQLYKMIISAIPVLILRFASASLSASVQENGIVASDPSLSPRSVIELHDENVRDDTVVVLTVGEQREHDALNGDQTPPESERRSALFYALESFGVSLSIMGILILAFSAVQFTVLDSSVLLSLLVVGGIALCLSALTSIRHCLG